MSLYQFNNNNFWTPHTGSPRKWWTVSINKTTGVNVVVTALLACIWLYWLTIYCSNNYIIPHTHSTHQLRLSLNNTVGLAMHTWLVSKSTLAEKVHTATWSYSIYPMCYPSCQWLRACMQEKCPCDHAVIIQPITAYKASAGCMHEY